MHRIEVEAAYVLHSRPFRETSLLVDIFTHKHGRLSVIAKGVRTPKSSLKALLQPFLPLWITCLGRGELLTVRQAESRGANWILKGKLLLCAFYLNELCVKLMHRWDPHEDLFEQYEWALSQLSREVDPQIVLRIFEKSLLKAIGYEIPLKCDAYSGEIISPDHYYFFDVERGPILTKQSENSRDRLFRGKSLLALEQEQFEDKHVLSDVRRLLRSILDHVLGNQMIETRKWL